MIRDKNPIDFRPFQPRAKLESQLALEAQYGRIAIEDVAAAIMHLKRAGRANRSEGA